MSVKVTIATLLLLSILTAAMTQEPAVNPSRSAFGVIVYAEGESVTIIRGGRPSRYDAYTGEPLGLPVYTGDMIQTDPDTYVEVQLLPSRSLVKVAENTSFVIERIGASGDGVFQLTYGRLRARVDRLAATEPFEIRGVGAVGGVRGTDFGADEIADPSGGGSVTRIYCFDGIVSVATTIPALMPETVVLEADQMVSISVSAPGEVPVTEAEQSEDNQAAATPSPAPEPIDSGIVAFWQRKDFVAEPLTVEEALERYPAIAVPVSELRLPVGNQLESPDAAGTAGEMESELSAIEDAAAEPEDAVDTTETTGESEAIRAAEAVSVEGDTEPVSRLDTMDPERRARLAGTSRIAGYTMTGLGILAEGAAAGLYFYGDQLFPSWPAASDPNTAVIIGAAGGVSLIFGILALLLGAQLSN